MMNYDDFLELCKSRRSCRAFKEKQVSDELIRKVIDAGRWVPSSHNLQATLVVRIKDKLLRKEIVSFTQKLMGIDIDPFYNAPEIILVAGFNQVVDLSLLDGSLVMENMMLAAHLLGLGTCWINTAQYNKDVVKKVLSKLNVNLDNAVGVGYLALGYRDDEGLVPLARKENRVFAI